jgi:hypothetical protein
LEVNEQDLQLLSDPEVNSAYDSQGPDATVTVEAENIKKTLAAQHSPVQSLNKKSMGKQESGNGEHGHARSKN